MEGQSVELRLMTTNCVLDNHQRSDGSDRLNLEIQMVCQWVNCLDHQWVFQMAHWMAFQMDQEGCPMSPGKGTRSIEDFAI